MSFQKLVSAIVLMLAATPVPGQVASRIRGVVRDSSDAVVVNVKVTAATGEPLIVQDAHVDGLPSLEN